jgi:hypothetical protein
MRQVRRAVALHRLPNKGSVRYYMCKNNHHLGRAGEPIDALVEGFLLELLAKKGIAARLAKTSGGINT